MLILGLDPGLQVTGYGLLDDGPSGPTVVEAGVIRSTESRETTDLAPRLVTLYDGLMEVLEQHKPGVMAMEQLYAHYEHPRTAILMAHARGCFILAASKMNIDVVSYAATSVKKTITGHGRASKEQMQHAIQRELGLQKLPEPHDVSDALALALCHYFRHATSITSGSRSVRFQGVNRAMLNLDQDDDS
jgi:crossover junction endodeoxyribonuclease RuvC